MREILGLYQQTNRLRANLEKSRQGDFIIGRDQSPEASAKQKENSATQYQKYEDSGTIPYPVMRSKIINFRKI